MYYQKKCRAGTFYQFQDGGRSKCRVKVEFWIVAVFKQTKIWENPAFITTKKSVVSTTDQNVILNENYKLKKVK